MDDLTTRRRLRELACAAALEVNAAPAAERERLHDFFRNTFMRELDLGGSLRLSDESLLMRAVRGEQVWSQHQDAHGHGYGL